MFEQVTLNEERERRQSMVYLVGVLVLALAVIAIVLFH
jgi:hypothetical protein